MMTQKILLIWMRQWLVMCVMMKCGSQLDPAVWWW